MRKEVVFTYLDLKFIPNYPVDRSILPGFPTNPNDILEEFIKTEHILWIPKSQKDLTTTEKFIKVTIGGQNKGKIDTPMNVWNLGNIIDSEGRNFIPNGHDVNPWISKENGCGEI